MVSLQEIRIGDFFELQSSSEDEKNKIASVKKIGQRNVLAAGKWVSLDRLIPLKITEDILLHAGFTQFDWLKESSVFECNYFKCALDSNGVNLFCDNLTNLKPLKYLHKLQNLYFDLTGEELDVNITYIKTVNTEMV